MHQRKRKNTRETRDPYTGLPSALLDEIGIDDKVVKNQTNGSTALSRRHKRKQSRLQKKASASKARQEWKERQSSTTYSNDDNNIVQEVKQKQKDTPRKRKREQQSNSKKGEGKNLNVTKKKRKPQKDTKEQNENSSIDDPDKKEIKRLERLLGIDRKRKRKAAKGDALEYADVFGEEDDAILDLLKFCDRETRPSTMNQDELNAIQNAKRTKGVGNMNDNGHNLYADDSNDELSSDQENEVDNEEESELEEDFDYQNELTAELEDEFTEQLDNADFGSDQDSEEENEYDKLNSKKSVIDCSPDDDVENVDDDLENDNPGESKTSLIASFDEQSNEVVKDTLKTQSQTRKKLKSEQKYIPPNQKKNISMQQEAVKRRVRGLLNRVADVNASGIADTLVQLFQTGVQSVSEQEIASWYANLTLNSVRDGSGLAYINPYVRSHAAIASHIAVHVDSIFLATLIVFAIRRIQTELEVTKEFNGSISENEEPNSNDAYGYVAMICSLYEQKAISCQILYSLIRYIADQLNSTRLGLLLALLRHSGSQLRIDDPRSLKDIINFIIETADAVKLEPRDDGSDVKLQILLDLISDIATNRVKKSAMRQANEQYMWASITDSPISASISDLLDDNFIVSRGWDTSGKRLSQTENDIHLDKNLKRHKQNSNKDSSDPDLQTLASLLRLNTEFRKSVFMVIMTSTSVTDACERLETLGGFDQKRGQDKDTALVLIHSCCSEKVFNPFYSYLSIKFCQRSRNCRFTFEFVLRDFLKSLRDEKSAKISQRKRKILSQMLVQMWEASVLSLSVFRHCEDFNECPEEEKSFYIVTLRELLKRLVTLERNKLALFKKLSAESWNGADEFRISLAVFFRREICSDLDRTCSELAMKAINLLESKVQS